MLQKLRDKTQGIITGVIIGLICLTFALWGIQNFTKGSRCAVVAKVNGSKIACSKLLTYYERAKRYNLGKVKQQILQELIEVTAVNQELAKLHLGIPAEQVMSLILQDPVFQSDGKFSEAKFRNYLSNMLFTESEFIQEFTDSILNAEMQKGIVASAFILPDETAILGKYLHQKRDLRYGRLVATPKGILVNPKAVADYYVAHKAEFVVPAKVSIEYIELTTQDLKKKLVVTDQVLENFYRNHITQYTTPQRWQVKHLLVTSLEEVPKVTFDNTKALWLTATEVTPEIARNLTKLKVGQVTEPIATKEGYHLIKLLQVQKPQVKAFATVKAAVHKAYEQHQLLQLFTQYHETLTDLTYMHADSLKPAATALGLPIKTTGLFTKLSNLHPKLIEAAFSDQVLQQKYNSNPIELTNGTIVVLRVKQQVPEAQVPFKQAQAIIEKKLRAELVAEKTSQVAQEVLQALQNNAASSDIAKKYNVVWHLASNVTLNSKQLDSQILQSAFKLPKPSVAKPAVTLVPLKNGDFIIVQVLKVTPGSSAIKVRALPHILGTIDYNTWIQGVLHRAKIKINNNELCL